MAFVHCVLPVLLAAGSPALAGERSRVAVLVFAQDVFSKKAAAFAEHYGGQRFLREPGTELVQSDALISGARSPKEQEIFDAASTALKRGMEAYDNLDLDAAVKVLSLAVEKLESVPAQVEGDREHRLISALTYLGAAHVLSGDPEKGQGTFRRLLTFERRARLDKALFPPSLVDTFEGIRKEVVEGPSSGLAVVSTPSYGKVFVDGVFRGVTPVSVPGLAVGDHLVVVRSNGFAPCSRKVNVDAAEEASANCPLTALPDNERFQRVLAEAAEEMEDDEPMPASLKALVGPGLGGLVLGKVARRGQEVEYQLVLYDANSGQPLRGHDGVWHESSPTFYQEVENVFSFLCTGRKDVLESRPKVVDPGPARLRDEELFEEEATPLYKRWWFWTALGAGAAATTVVLVLLLAGGGGPDSQILLVFD